MDDAWRNQTFKEQPVGHDRMVWLRPSLDSRASMGSDSWLFLRYKSAAYVDLNQAQKFSLRNLRSGCSNSLMAAGGLLNVPCFSTGCVCNYPLQTSFSMYHMLLRSDSLKKQLAG